MTVNAALSLPLYLQIRDALLEQIESGAYAVGDRLPSERELAEHYGVSRMTARQAIRLLIQDGRISTSIGKGTFVEGPHFDQELRDLTSFTDDMRRAGARPSSRVVHAGVGPAARDVASHLEVEPGVEVVSLHRVRMADGEIIALERASLLHDRCPGILDGSDFSRQSLYQSLRDRYGVRLVWASEVITARMPDADERLVLEMDESTPVLALKRVTYDDQDHPVEYVRSCYHSGRYQLRTVLRERTRSALHGG